MNAQLKRWPSWVLLTFVIVGLITFGATRDSGPRTADDRIESITKRLACPVCQGESVYESRNPASNGIREAVKIDVRAGVLGDDDIIQRISFAYEGEELLVPRAGGIEALAWALPATAFVLGVSGLTIAFRRWQATARALGAPTKADFELVSQALEREPDES